LAFFEQRGFVSSKLEIAADGFGVGGNKKKRECGPGDENPAISEVGATEERERCRAEIGGNGRRVDLLVEAERIRFRATCGTREVDLDKIEDRGDGQSGQKQFARSVAELEVDDPNEA